MVDGQIQPGSVSAFRVCFPVIHYCIGGLKIDENSAVLGSDS